MNEKQVSPAMRRITSCWWAHAPYLPGHQAVCNPCGDVRMGLQLRRKSDADVLRKLHQHRPASEMPPHTRACCVTPVSLLTHWSCLVR